MVAGTPRQFCRGVRCLTGSLMDTRYGDVIVV